MTTKMSEARFNDLVYMILKKMFFEPCIGEGNSPRECDIRVCMNMSQPKMMTGKNPLLASILSPTEISPRSHEIFYDIDFDVVLKKCRNYMEDHWFKQKMPQEWVERSVEYYPMICEDVMKVQVP